MYEILKHRIATKVAFSWYGSRRAIESHHQLHLSSSVHADPAAIRTTKQLYNPKLAPLQEINAFRHQIRSHWESISTPYPEPGIRLILKENTETFTTTMHDYQIQLTQLACKVQSHRDDILSDAILRLGDLYNAYNYPQDLTELFGLEYSFPSLLPPGDLPSHIYNAQYKQAQQRLDEAVTLAQQAFTAELADMVATLQDRLQPNPDGTKKIFHDTALTNLTDFFDRFAKLNFNSDKDLNDVVAQAKALTQGISTKELRSLPELRKQISTGLATVAQHLQPLIITQPRRRLLKPLPAQPQLASA